VLYSTRKTSKKELSLWYQNERRAEMIQTTIRIPTELHQKLKELAKKKGLTINALIVQALWKL
jgi:predicted HicB family RNase H-like nuclease